VENPGHTGDTMNHNFRKVYLAVLAGGWMVLFAPGCVDSAQDAATGLLIRLQINLNYEGSSSLEYLYYRDGLVITRSVDDAAAFYLRGTLAPQDLVRLGSILGENHVGLISANDCKVSDPFPNGSSFEGALTWFGRNGRQNYLTFGNPGEGLCSTELNTLFSEIYALPVNYADTITTVP